MRTFSLALTAATVAVLLTASAASVAFQPQQFNPNGYVKWYVDIRSTEVFESAALTAYNPIGAALDTANGRLYVLQQFGIVQVVDTLTNQSLPELNIGPGAFNSIIYDPQNNLLYVAANNQSDLLSPGRVLALNASTGRTMATMPSVAEPKAMALDTANGRLFVGGVYVSSGIGVIDTSNNTALQSIQATGSFETAVFDPANGDVYFPNEGATIVVVDGATDQLATPVNVDHSQLGVSFDPYNNVVYFGLFVVPPQTRIIGLSAANSVVANFTLAPSFVDVFADPRSGTLYVVGSYGYPKESISAVDPSTDRITHTFNTTIPTLFSLYDSTSQQEYLVTPFQYLMEFNLAKVGLAGALPLFADPSVLAYDGHDRGVYVYSILPGTNASEVDLLVNQTVVSSVSLGFVNTSADVQMATSSKTGLAYVSMGNGSIFVLNGTASRVLGRIQTETPSAMAYDATEDTLYLLQPQSATTQILALNLASGKNVSQMLDFPATAMVLDEVHDRLIVGGAAGGGISILNPATLTTTAAFSLAQTLSGSIQLLSYDSGDNLIYASNGYVLVAADGASGQPLWQSIQAYYHLPLLALQYDPSNGYVYALTPQGATVVVGAVDYPIGYLQVVSGFYGAAGIAFDPADGYLYVGDQLLGAVAIAQPGPLISSAQTSTSTETVTSTQTVPLTIISSQTITLPPLTRTLTSTSTVAGPTVTVTLAGTSTQTVATTKVQTVSSIPLWAYASMGVLLVVGFVAGYLVVGRSKKV